MSLRTYSTPTAAVKYSCKSGGHNPDAIVFTIFYHTKNNNGCKRAADTNQQNIVKKCPLYSLSHENSKEWERWPHLTLVLFVKWLNKVLSSHVVWCQAAKGTGHRPEAERKRNMDRWTGGRTEDGRKTESKTRSSERQNTEGMNKRESSVAEHILIYSFMSTFLFQALSPLFLLPCLPSFLSVPSFSVSSLHGQQGLRNFLRQHWRHFLFSSPRELSECVTAVVTPPPA